MLKNINISEFPFPPYSAVRESFNDVTLNAKNRLHIFKSIIKPERIVWL